MTVAVAGVVDDVAAAFCALACIAAPCCELPVTPASRSRSLSRSAKPGSPPVSILFIVGDPTGPICSEFIPSAPVWLFADPSPWLIPPGIIASSYLRNYAWSTTAPLPCENSKEPNYNH